MSIKEYGGLENVVEAFREYGNAEISNSHLNFSIVDRKLQAVAEKNRRLSVREIQTIATIVLSLCGSNDDVPTLQTIEKGLERLKTEQLKNANRPFYKSRLGAILKIFLRLFRSDTPELTQSKLTNQLQAVKEKIDYITGAHLIQTKLSKKAVLVGETEEKEKTDRFKYELKERMISLYLPTDDPPINLKISQQNINNILHFIDIEDGGSITLISKEQAQKQDKSDSLTPVLYFHEHPEPTFKLHNKGAGDRSYSLTHPKFETQVQEIIKKQELIYSTMRPQVLAEMSELEEERKGLELTLNPGHYERIPAAVSIRAPEEEVALNKILPLFDAAVQSKKLRIEDDDPQNPKKKVLMDLVEAREKLKNWMENLETPPPPSHHSILGGLSGINLSEKQRKNIRMIVQHIILHFTKNDLNMDQLCTLFSELCPLVNHCAARKTTVMHDLYFDYVVSELNRGALDTLENHFYTWLYRIREETLRFAATSFQGHSVVESSVAYSGAKRELGPTVGLPNEMEERDAMTSLVGNLSTTDKESIKKLFEDTYTPEEIMGRLSVVILDKSDKQLSYAKFMEWFEDRGIEASDILNVNEETYATSFKQSALIYFLKEIGVININKSS